MDKNVELLVVETITKFHQYVIGLSVRRVVTKVNPILIVMVIKTGI